MTRASIREYVAVMRARYEGASKAERGRLLTEFCTTTGYHRKAAIRLLNQRARPGGGRGRGRQRTYGLAVKLALKRVWEASERSCGKRLAPFLPELVRVLERHGELQVSPAVREQLLGLSAATIDRLLASERRLGRRPSTQSRAARALQAQVPLRTFGEWRDVSPGSGQADLVAHCGASTAGFYLTTLLVVDVATSWSECEPIWGKGQQRVGSGVHRIRQRLPFTLRELHTDNGGEFLNDVLAPWCRREGIRFTRGRPYRKNDQAYVEQKNWMVVRRLVGYDRYASKQAYVLLQQLYRRRSQYVNFFQPVRKLVSKERVGAKVVKRFDQAQTPYQRLLASGVLTPEAEQALRRQYEGLNPVRLQAEIDALLDQLTKAAERARPATPAGVAGVQDADVG